MLKEVITGLLQQHGKKAPSASSPLPTQAPKRLEQSSGVAFGWRPYGIMTGREELLFEADPMRFLNDPRFAGRRSMQPGMTQADDHSTPKSLRLVFFPEE